MENAPTVKSAKTKLLIAASYYAPAIGGLERYASEMAKVAHQANYEVVVVCSGNGASVTKESSDGIRIYRLPTQFMLSNTPVSLRWHSMIKGIIADEAPDIINVHMPVPYLTDLVIFASKGIPKVVTYHSGSMKKHLSLCTMVFTGSRRAMALRSAETARSAVMRSPIE
jgi:glycosyltransferase involved in cell wall biosynthesis